MLIFGPGNAHPLIAAAAAAAAGQGLPSLPAL